ncbi:hypothetical protein [Metabacillus fastidiosus]|uniref:hypothetical protein n=1 Tax=Metabacillus fastidiosus TaxID=1458 RepID=UPI002DBDD8D2|nr:hypothetical protein [Metabacillus fastidiosus]MEC2076879.1 hypothetical protein [Metabacillus fastidiosus]
MESFQAGQVWSFEGREDDPNPCVIILEKESFRDKTAVHIQIRGVKIQTSDGQVLTEIGHVPVCEESIRDSVQVYQGETSVREAGLEGIKAWRNAGGGVYNIPLKEIISTIEQSL